MDWKDIAAAVGKAGAPLLGTLLAGPAGGTVGAMVASALGASPEPATVAQALDNPEAAAKLAEVESAERVRLQELAHDQARAELSAAVQAAGDVNQTMRAEAASEHWPTYSWRPAIGFAVALAVALAVLTVFGAFLAAVVYGRAEALAQLPAVLGAVAAIIGVVAPILGIASWFRGRMQADPSVPTVNRG